MNTPENFLRTLKTNGIILSEDHVQRFDLFYNQLIKANQTVNLTRIIDKKEVYQKHFLDSLTPLFIPLEDAPQVVLDIGSGAGFPGIPLAIMKPQFEIILLESTGKKVHFLDKMKEELNLPNIFPVKDRVEEYEPHRQFDYVMSRAVASLPIIVELSYRHLKVNGTMIFFKGPKIKDELLNSEASLKHLGLVLNLKTIDIDEVQRYLVTLIKIKEVPLKTRSFGQIKHKALW